MNLTKSQVIRIIKITICVVSILVCSLGIYNISKNASEYGSLVKEKERLEGQAVAAKEEYEEHQKTVLENAYTEAKDGENAEAKEVATHNESYLIMSTISEAFFKEFYTWNDSESYLQRADNVSSVATEEIRNNESIFDDGTDSLGGNYIEITGVKSQFVNSEAYPVDGKSSVVRVTHKSWFNDDKNISGNSTRYYYVTFDRENQMITNLEQVFSSED